MSNVGHYWPTLCLLPYMRGKDKGEMRNNKLFDGRPHWSHTSSAR